ncbi:MAG: hypothetical protein M3N32_02090 [Actinomycetota bacterium]|nr:hypothetical protein [Actinomycetota bacterium]
MPTLTAGVNTVGFHNQGRQLHEMNLVELSPGKSVDDVVRWLRQPGGPPPMAFLGGVAVKAGEEGVASLELKRGSTYACICATPDMLGNFAPHATKGMFTHPFIFA